MWVNTTCHPEWLKYFDVQSFSVPTVVYYNPTHHKHEYTIGKFTKRALAEAQLQFVRGKLSLRDTPTKQEDINLIKKDCQAHLFEEANESDENFDDILAEILAEEEERKKEQEEDLRYPKKETKKDKKNKKKKNKNKYKAKKKEDL